MKKFIKFILIIIMLLGIAFSVTNFITIKELKASGMQGVWVYDNGTKTCEGFGNECDIMVGFEPNG